MASSLSALRSRARIRADAVGNNFFSDAEINDYLNVGLGELHDILVLQYEDYYVGSVSFDVVSGKDSYPFDTLSLDNFYKCLGLDVDESGEVLRVRRFSFHDRNRYSSDVNLVGRGGTTDYMYQVRGDSIHLIPKPTSSGTATFWYVPSFARLTGDEDTVDSRIMSNWEEYAVLVAVFKMKEKEELSTTTVEKELARIEDRIHSAAMNRDAGESIGITDERSGAGIGTLEGY